MIYCPFPSKSDYCSSIHLSSCRRLILILHKLFFLFKAFLYKIVVNSFSQINWKSETTSNSFLYIVFHYIYLLIKRHSPPFSGGNCFLELNNLDGHYCDLCRKDISQVNHYYLHFAHRFKGFLGLFL